MTKHIHNVLEFNVPGEFKNLERNPMGLYSFQQIVLDHLDKNVGKAGEALKEGVRFYTEIHVNEHRVQFVVCLFNKDNPPSKETSWMLNAFYRDLVDDLFDFYLEMTADERQQNEFRRN
jgi:hypothetical protein